MSIQANGRATPGRTPVLVPSSVSFTVMSVACLAFGVTPGRVGFGAILSGSKPARHSSPENDARWSL